MTGVIQRAVAEREKTEPGYLECPACRSIDWERDGVRVVGAQLDGELHRFTVAPPAETPMERAWYCSACGYAVASDSDLGVELLVD